MSGIDPSSVEPRGGGELNGGDEGDESGGDEGDESWGGGDEGGDGGGEYILKIMTEDKKFRQYQFCRE